MQATWTVSVTLLLLMQFTVNLERYPSLIHLAKKVKMSSNKGATKRLLLADFFHGKLALVNCRRYIAEATEAFHTLFTWTNEKCNISQTEMNS